MWRIKVLYDYNKLQEAQTCSEILKLFKILSNEKKLEVFIKLRDILWETKDAIYDREENSTICS